MRERSGDTRGGDLGPEFCTGKKGKKAAQKGVSAYPCVNPSETGAVLGSAYAALLQLGC